MFCNRRSLLPSWAQCGPCVSFCGKLPGAVAAISSRQCGARGGQCGKRVALKAPSSAHWSLWGGGWRLNSNLLGHIHCMWKSPLENAKVVSKYWQRPQQKMFRSRAIFSSLTWSYSKPYMWYLLEEPFSENFKVTSYLQRLSAPHPPIPGQGSATDAPGKAKGNGHHIRFMKSKNYFAAAAAQHFVGGEKLNHKLSTELNLERAPLLSFTFHDSPITISLFQISISLFQIIISQTPLISPFPFLDFHFKHFSMSEVCFGRLSFTRPRQTSQRTNYMIV